MRRNRSENFRGHLSEPFFGDNYGAVLSSATAIVSARMQRALIDRFAVRLCANWKPIYANIVSFWNYNHFFFGNPIAVSNKLHAKLTHKYCWAQNNVVVGGKLNKRVCRPQMQFQSYVFIKLHIHTTPQDPHMAKKISPPIYYVAKIKCENVQNMITARASLQCIRSPLLLFSRIHINPIISSPIKVIYPFYLTLSSIHAPHRSVLSHQSSIYLWY